MVVSTSSALSIVSERYGRVREEVVRDRRDDRREHTGTTTTDRRRDHDHHDHRQRQIRVVDLVPERHEGGRDHDRTDPPDDVAGGRPVRVAAWALHAVIKAMMLWLRRVLLAASESSACESSAKEHLGRVVGGMAFSRAVLEDHVDVPGVLAGHDRDAARAPERGDAIALPNAVPRNFEDAASSVRSSSECVRDSYTISRLRAVTGPTI